MRRLVCALGALTACAGPTPVAAPPDHVDPHLAPDQVRALEELRDAADAVPGDAALHRRSGLAHMHVTLAGLLSQQRRAEHDLELAFDRGARDPLLLRSLGRFYNLRAVAGDGSKAERQVEVYAAYLGDAEPRDMNAVQFTAWSFSRLGVILERRNRGALVGTLQEVEALEAALAERVAAQPEDVELRALAGNFAFFFAGNVPFRKGERVATAVEHFEVLRARWDELPARARDRQHCPNTRENFMFELAEGYLVLRRVAEARAIYEELVQVAEPYTRPKEQIAFVAAERLRNAERYAGQERLMPPWPSDQANCIVCHAWTADIAMASLYTLEPIAIEDIPRRRAAAPLPFP
jgi:hypothetical protein